MRRGRAGISGAVIALALALVVMPGPAVASETELTVDGVLSVARADLDGDGARELAVIANRGGTARLVVEVYGHGTGAWDVLATLPLDSGFLPDGERPLRSDRDVLALVEWGDRGSTSILLATVRGDGGPPERCCLRLHRLSVLGDRLVAEPVYGDPRAPDNAMVVDFEGDGTDELILVSEPDPEGGDAELRVLRFEGSAFGPMDVPPAEIAGLGWGNVGDTDGEPGDELVLMSNEDPPRYGRLRTDGAEGLVVEMAPPFDGDTDGPMWIAGARGGTLWGQALQGTHVLEWPRGGALTSTRYVGSTESRMLEPIGFGSPAAFIAYDPMDMTYGPPMPSALYDLDGELLAELRPTPAVERLRRYVRDFRAFGNVGHSLYPYSGPLPGGLGDGTQVYFSGGRAVLFRPDGTVDTGPASALVDVGVLGSLGPDAAWVAVSDGFGWWGFPSLAWLYPGPPEGFSVHVVPTAGLFAPEPDDGLLRPTLDGAAELPPDGDGRPRLATTPDGFTLSIGGPPGSTVLVVRDHSLVRQGVLTGDRALRVDVVPRERDQDDRMEAAVLLVTPIGQAFGADWVVEVLREGPAIQAAARTLDGEWRAVVSGEATPGSSVSVDGAAPVVGEDGSFSATVEAGLWPRAVSVVARDPLGREAAARVDVVGMVDYRSWPWIPILGALTVAFGAVLFVRTPRRRDEPAAAGVLDEGVLEEIDAG